MKSLKFILTVMSACIFFFNMNAQSFFTEGVIEYRILDKTTQTCEVKGISKHDCQELSIPSSVEYGGKTYTVVALGRYAFEMCNYTITSITLPETVTTIGEYAFYECRYLQNLSLPKNLISIKDCAFYLSAIKTMVLPPNLESIGNNAFWGCTFLKDVSIPKTVREFGENVFDYCPSLISIEVDSENPILLSEDGILYNKEKSKLIAYPIGKENECFDVPQTVVEIGGKAFANAQKLASISFPSHIHKIGDGAFEWCGELTEITLPEKLNIIGEYAFRGCGIRELSIPSSVQIIGNGAFMNCYQLEKAFFPDTVISLGKEMFAMCNILKNVKLPNSLTSLPYGFFRDCLEMNTFDCGQSIKEIGDYAFESCGMLSIFKGSKNLQKIGNYAFNRCWRLESFPLADTMESLGHGVFNYCTSLRETNIPSNLKIIPDSCFLGTAIEELVLPECVNEIGSYAFSNNHYLKEIQFPNTLGVIGKEAFSRCFSLEKILIPSPFIDIYQGAFEGCESLKEVKILSKTLYLESDAFGICNNIESIYTNCKNPYYIPLYTFTYPVYDNCLLYVPKGSVEKYLEKTYWNKFSNIIEWDSNDIEQIEINDSQIEIFDLNGKHINQNSTSLPHGLYIIRSHNKTTKVIL